MSTNTTVVNQWLKRLPLAVILLAVILTLAFAFQNLQPAVHLGSAGTNNESSIQRSIEADAARYTAMAEYYAARETSNILNSHAADAARYTAGAEYFVARGAANIQRGRIADAARYIAMAEYYAAMDAGATK